LSPSWFVADLTVAEMACRRDDRTPWYYGIAIPVFRW